jgi:hypothetical protein
MFESIKVADKASVLATKTNGQARISAYNLIANDNKNIILY